MNIDICSTAKLAPFGETKKSWFLGSRPILNQVPSRADMGSLLHSTAPHIDALEAILISEAR